MCKIKIIVIKYTCTFDEKYVFRMVQGKKEQ